MPVLRTLFAVLAGGLTLVALTSVPAQEAARPGTLEQELLRIAPKVIKHLQDKGFKNVGVLKFRVSKDGRTSDNFGPLNLAAARRLEAALALSNDDDEQTQINLIRDANTVAAGIKGANHLTAEGRKLLFSRRYPLAWGNEQVEPDAFVSGLIQIKDDLEEMTVHLLVFGKDEGSLRRVAIFQAATDSSALVETGSNFLLRGIGDEGRIKITKGKAVPKELKDALAVAKTDPKKVLTPEQGKTAPVTLKVYYSTPGRGGEPNFKRVPLEFKGDRAVIPEPQEGQGVVLALERDKTKTRYGVVVQVNGENTLLQERQPPIDCTMWILEPGQKPFSIRGFRTENTLKPFRVKSVAESKKDEVNYGADVGTITVVVFQEAGNQEPPADLPEDVRAVRRGLPEGEFKDAAALKVALRKGLAREEEKITTRGVVGAATDVPDKPLSRTAFVPDPIPIQSLTITYYQPQR